MSLPLAFLLATDFLNFTYETNPCRENVPVPVVMRSGSFAYFDKKTAAGFDLHVSRVVRGSLARGTQQAVVVIACDFPADGGTAAAYLFEERRHGASLLGKVAEANWGSDWGAGPDSITVRFSNGTLFVRQCENDDCSAYSATRYRLRNGRLSPPSAHGSAAK